MNSIDVFLITGAIFLLGGTVKGTVGFGLPLVSITLLTPFYGLVDAIALMVFPAVMTNFWQAVTGGHFRASCRRLWPLYLAGAVFTAGFATVLLQVHTRWPTILLGSVIVAYSVSGLASWRFGEPGSRERWLGPVTGMTTGCFTGLTGVLVFPLNAYLQSLRLDRSMMIQAMGVYLLLANAAVASVFGWQGAFPQAIAPLAAIGVVAGLMGMAIGRRIRERLSNQAFDRVFYISLATIGAYIAIRAAIG